MSDAPVVEWARLKAHELRALAARDAIVILPVASIEQHGPHLPVMTDSRLGAEIARRAAERAFAAAPTVVAPVVWSGLSEHHMPFGGTLSVSHATFRALIIDLVEAIGRQGFRRILISNSHGGNIIAMQQIADELGGRRDDGPAVAATTYAAEAAEALAALLEDQAGVQHACEAETSMMMAVEPDLVDASDLGAIGQTDPSRALSMGRGAFRWRPFEDLTADGVLGAPARATAEKGEALLEAGADAVAALLTDAALWRASEDRRGEGTGGVPFRR
ncbi:MAG: creatininase family protein [Pseudomonadota bacterium]